MRISIRPVERADRDFILDLAPRLMEFGAVQGRDQQAMIEHDRTVLARAVDEPGPDTAVFVATDESGLRMGFIHLTTDFDYYSNTATAHIADVVVARGMESRGIGTTLIRFGEQWARERRSALLTLNVFAANQDARNLYRRLGFQEEWVRCIKRL